MIRMVETAEQKVPERNGKKQRRFFAKGCVIFNSSEGGTA